MNVEAVVGMGDDTPERELVEEGLADSGRCERHGVVEREQSVELF